MSEWTIQRVLAWSTGYLTERSSDTPRLDAELLLSHTLGLSRIQLYTNFDKPLQTDEREPFKAALKRRVAGEPVAYITGVKEFMSLAFAVSPSVLIPRPDTEVLVEQALAEAKRRGPGPLRILDVGTGSGCIAVSLAKKLPEAELAAWDVDEDALKLAHANAVRHGVDERVRFHCMDALADDAWQGDAGESFDMIVSNPPYIAPAERPTLSVSVAGYEPARALFAGADGLAFYRVFADRARARLTPGGVLMVEIGSSQGEAVAGLLAAAGWVDVAVHKDYGKLDRVVVARAAPAAAAAV